MFPYSLENHAHLEGGNAAERLRSTLAYGWVECCSDVAGCGMSSYKISNLVYFTSATLFTVNDYDEHVECLYECMLLPLCMTNNCICVCSTSKHSVFSILIFMNAHVHGAGSLDG